MITVKLAALVFLTLYAAGISYLALLNLVYPFVRRLVRAGYGAGLAFPILVLLIHVGTAIGLAIGVSLQAAIIAFSLTGFSWSLALYFPERFAHRSDRIGLARSMPLLLPLMSFAGFVFSVLSLQFFAAWYWTALPALIWFGFGSIFAEMAIRGRMIRLKKSGSDGRKLAIFAINENQGRSWTNRGWVQGRYPFP